MTQLSDYLPPPTELARQVQVFPVIRAGRKPKDNIWFFDSPKNNKRFPIKGDLAFCHMVLLEGDLTVSGYVASPVAVPGESPDAPCIELGAHVYRTDGSVEWWDFKRLAKGRAKRKDSAVGACEPLPSELAARAAGITYCIKTDGDLAGREIRFDNWLNLCAMINRSRTQYLADEAERLRQRMDASPNISLSTLLSIPHSDTACMLAVVAISLQKGVLHTNLDSQLFGPACLLTRAQP